MIRASFRDRFTNQESHRDHRGYLFKRKIPTSVVKIFMPFHNQSPFFNSPSISTCGAGFVTHRR